MKYSKARRLATAAKNLSQDDVQAVISEFERENPGKSSEDMTPQQFADLCLKRMKIRGG